MSKERSVTADELTDSKRQPRLQRLYQRAASIRDRVRALKAPSRSPAFLRGTRVIYYGAIVAMVGVLALVGAATLPTLFGYHTYAVNGGSMEPTLKKGSAAVTRPTSPLALEIGDVISRHDDGSAILHRIVDITTVDGERLFITQGDQNRTPDVTPVQLAGFGDKVVYSVPYAGYILNFARSWLGRLILLAAPAVFVAITLARRFRSKWRERRSEAAAVSLADNEALLTSADAVSETLPGTEEESVAVEAGTRTLAGRLRSLWRGRHSKAEPVAVEAAQPETPPESEQEPVVIEDSPAEASQESKDEPVAIEAALAEAPPDVPDSPFPIEAALAAKAKTEAKGQEPESPYQDANTNETPTQGDGRPALRVVPSGQSNDDLPAFLIEQMKRRSGVGERTNGQDEAGEESVA